ncbi:MAG: hypothetical protein SO038_00725 [Campylobacter sp.]|nr:hypothetical protein [Campylobacter sp.]
MIFVFKAAAQERRSDSVGANFVPLFKLAAAVIKTTNSVARKRYESSLLRRWAVQGSKSKKHRKAESKYLSSKNLSQNAL